MPDTSSLGYWVRRFLMEYLVHERGLSRDSQEVTATLSDCCCRTSRAKSALQLIDWLSRTFHQPSRRISGTSGD